MNSFIEFLLFAVLTIILGVSWWGIGRYLRGKGKNTKLDSMEKGYYSATHWVSKVLGPVGRAFLSTSAAMSKVPFLGSRNQREILNQIHKISQPPKGKK